MKRIREQYPDNVKIVFKNFPLRSHKQANKAALYVLAAGNQGMYYEMHNKIFERYKELKQNEDLPLELAQELGLDVDLLKADLKDPALQNQINKEANELRSTGLRLAVPKILINGQELDRGRRLDDVIDGILKSSP